MVKRNVLYWNSHNNATNFYMVCGDEITLKEGIGIEKAFFLKFDLISHKVSEIDHTTFNNEVGIKRKSTLETWRIPKEWRIDYVPFESKASLNNLGNWRNMAKYVSLLLPSIVEWEKKAKKDETKMSRHMDVLNVVKLALILKKKASVKTPLNDIEKLAHLA
ncbi:MAG: hypothetical protein WC437_05000 [Patescibacteria group bacterium]|jgi:hypothetical protein